MRAVNPYGRATNQTEKEEEGAMRNGGIVSKEMDNMGLTKTQFPSHVALETLRAERLNTSTYKCVNDSHKIQSLS
jgi:hypothetical protein